jgi:hypothetical protein
MTAELAMIVAAMAFLFSEKADFITGQTLLGNGGTSIGRAARPV